MVEGIIAVLSIFVVLPGIVFTFAYKSKKNKMELKKMERIINER
jgi:aminopeptidase C